MCSDHPRTNRPTQAGIGAMAAVVGLLHEASLQTARRLIATGRGQGQLAGTPAPSRRGPSSSPRR